MTSSRTRAHLGVRIFSEEEYHRAVGRIAELFDNPVGAREEPELLALLEAIDLWESKHEHWSEWV